MAVVPAGCVAGGLDVIAEVDHVDDVLYVPRGCVAPPMFPNAITGSPSFMMKPAMMVMKGSLPPAIVLGWLGSNVNIPPRLVSWNP